MSLTHTIIHPTMDKADDYLVGNPVPVHKVGETRGGVVVRGARLWRRWRPSPTRSGLPVATRYRRGADATPWLSRSRRHAGLMFLCRDSAAHARRAAFDPPSRPASTSRTPS